ELSFDPRLKIRRKWTSPLRPSSYQPVDSISGETQRAASLRLWLRCLTDRPVVIHRLNSKETSGASQLFLDAQQLVVLGDAISARRRARLNLAGAGADRKVGDKGVFGFAGAMADDRRVAAPTGQLNSLEGFCYRSDLVDLDQNAVGASCLNSP